VSLRDFIQRHHEDIIVEFAAFAKTLMPPGTMMTDAALRDHAAEILTEIAIDMGTAQTVAEQSNKSRGLGALNAMRTSGRLHADARIGHGFPMTAVFAEFRALRHTILRLYEESGATDMAEVRRFNESLDESLAESMTRFSAQADAFRNQFVGILSHDLRSPLGAITTGTALLAVPEDHPERRARVTARMMTSCQRMERLIRDLLDLTRTRLGGTIPLDRRDADLQKICEDVVTECQAAHPDAVIELKTSGSLAGQWDADRMTQVISNLVGNAIQHGDGTPVTLVAKEEEDAITLTVHNQGTPIPPEGMPSIFEPLARGPSEGITGGGSIGLGLFIARAIVTAHHGTIEATSSSESGTTFSVTLPKRGSAGSEKTWQPPPDQQGISNREGDEDSDASAREPKKASS
jgi:signal transduction histidine kinase